MVVISVLCLHNYFDDYFFTTSSFLLREHIPVHELSNLFRKYWKDIIAVAVLFIVLIFCVNVFVRFWKRFLCATKRTVIGDDEDWKNETRYRHKKNTSDSLQKTRDCRRECPIREGKR